MSQFSINITQQDGDAAEDIVTTMLCSATVDGSVSAGAILRALADQIDPPKPVKWIEPHRPRRGGF